VIQTDAIAPGSTDRSIIFVLSTAGLTIADFKLGYVRWDNGDGTSFAEVLSGALTALGSIVTAHTDNSAIYLDTAASGATKFLIRVDFPDAAFASGKDRVICNLYDDGNDVVAQKEFVLTSEVSDVTLVATGLDAISSTATGMIEVSKAVWDRVISAANHNIVDSSGRLLREVSATIFSSGTAQSGGNNSIQLASGGITANDQFRRAKVILIGGTGMGQEAIITSSVASTDTLTITPAWLTNPDATTEYEVIPGQAHCTVRNGGYDNGDVYIDTVNGSAGVEKGVNGTSTNKSSVIADSYIIAANENINHFAVTANSALTLPSDSTGLNFHGFQYTIALAGRECGGVEVHGANSVTGIALNTSGFNGPAFFLSGIGSCTLPPSNFNECGLFGTITVGTEGFFTLGNCASVFGLNPIIDYGSAKNASGFFLQSWQGGEVTIKNYGAGTGTYQYEMSGTGDLVIDATCSGGSIIIRGNISVTDNSGGAVTIVRDVNIDTVTAKTDNLPGAIPKGVELSNFGFLLVESSDGITPKPGITALAATISKDGASFGATTNAVTELSSGMYLITLTSSEMTADTVILRVTGTDAADRFITFKTDI